MTDARAMGGVTRAVSRVVSIVKATKWTLPSTKRRKHDVRESCKEDSEDDTVTASNNKRGGNDWDATKAGYSPGYLLRPNSCNGHRHDFSVRITPEDYPCNMTICWELRFRMRRRIGH